MKIAVLFFGATLDITVERRVYIELPLDAKAGDAFQKLVGDYPLLAKHRLLFSVNQQYATGDELLNDGDELAIFTAVSGG